MTSTRAKKELSTAERILDIAERLVQVRGFNSVSYADIAAELGITTASVHYHFPGKAELGQALISRYAGRFSEALSRIDHDLPDGRAKLEAYAGLYADVLRGKRMCLCGILAAEYQTLPTPMRTAVIGFFNDNQEWLAQVLTQGRRDHTLVFTGAKAEVAQSILSTLEGAMLVARPYGDLVRFNATTRQLLAGLTN
jgi:TetR/AcrR family transcriptional repressor of nem operon